MFTRTLSKSMKVTVLGAAGGIGQPLSLLLKHKKEVTNLALYDVANAVGVAADLSHICQGGQVRGYARDDISKALDGSDIVVIPAGVPRKPGMTRDDLFNVNAGIVKNLIGSVASTCPKAHILVISNPVNSTVPIAAEVLKKAGVYDPKRLFGVTSLDVVRANTFIGEATGQAISDLDITVVGGHSGPTIVPILNGFSDKLSQEQIEKLTHRIQYGGDEVVKAKDGTGSATLSMAYAACKFVNTFICGLQGGENCTECAFVANPDVDKRVQFFSTPVTFGKDGVKSIAPLPKVSDYEKTLLEKCFTELEGNIKKGVTFANQ